MCRWLEVKRGEEEEVLASQEGAVLLEEVELFGGYMDILEL